MHTSDSNPAESGQRHSRVLKNDKRAGTIAALRPRAGPIVGFESLSNAEIMESTDGDHVKNDCRLEK